MYEVVSPPFLQEWRSRWYVGQCSFPTDKRRNCRATWSPVNAIDYSVLHAFVWNTFMYRFNRDIILQERNTQCNYEWPVSVWMLTSCLGCTLLYGTCLFIDLTQALYYRNVILNATRNDQFTHCEGLIKLTSFLCFTRLYGTCICIDSADVLYYRNGILNATRNYQFTHCEGLIKLTSFLCFTRLYGTCICIDSADVLYYRNGILNADMNDQFQCECLHRVWVVHVCMEHVYLSI